MGIKNVFSSLSQERIKDLQEKSNRFKDDLNYIHSGLKEIDDFLTLYTANNPHIVLIESLSDIRDFIYILDNYKNIGIF